MNSSENSLTVSELTAKIKGIIEPQFSNIWVSGEISNFKHHSSGHMYFTIKDKSSELRCVMFKGLNRSIQFKPENGMDILLQGKITLYELRGQYQLIVQSIQPAGIGTLYLAFEALKKQLLSEGLFDQSKKMELPKFPRKIGLITSRTGAVLKDMINIFNRRAPYANLVLYPAIVQGEDASIEIVHGINRLSSIKHIDLIILARGGGSIEDLWPFNEELLARAISKCEIPIISAVGHETDVTISDMVADFRAPTPSAAAEIAIPSILELKQIINQKIERMNSYYEYYSNQIWQKLDFLSERHALQKPVAIINRHRQSAKKLSKTLEISINHLISINRSKIVGLEKGITALSPIDVLSRGYSIAFKKDGNIIRREDDVSIGESFILRTGEGRMKAKKKKSLSS